VDTWLEAGRSGAVYPWIGVLLIVELLALGGYHHRTGRGIATRALVTNALAGMALLAVAWFATHQRVEAALLSLALAGIAHAADLVARWPRGPRTNG
jgi:hypothetical protein